ncbi:hypothetical protein A2697_02925 [Candidatus Curtissbacteria bacterium RIFCSPHIGHO2_01_FULL_41_44]|nr:MAG: hypothetical protein A2697_02925 [Candidatus Curtissbacteria bacterium RIFCSPHIGHO2_01_FULL_41_44]OGD97048.1 MAG: hypothetical protein A3E71_02395 [Candidatus Curtissbacteria bacterium RIFCSPHIGHO2_12_FULL_42_33]OGE09926.1 MAG: hypothetical protein A3H87_04550 [Candidatus Curtissbacteria bacterium RIFCSPLOWO2_02_FULL_42_37]
MISHTIARHLFPHYFVHTSLAENELVPSITYDGIHHRAHGLTLAALFLYLQILVVLTVGLYVIKLGAPGVLGTASFGAEQIIEMTNARRSANGLPPLSFNGNLAAAAAAKAQDMFANDYWAHISPAGKTPWSFISSAGYRYVFAGENLARDYSDPGAVVNAWMNSSSHRANVLDKNFKEIGVAVASGRLGGREGTLVVQMFGTGISPSIAEVSSPHSKVTAEDGSEGKQDLNQPAQASALEIPQATERRELAAVNESVTVLASNKSSIAKTLSLSLVGLVFILFALEVLVTIKRAHVHLKNGVLAHLTLLGFVLLAVWYLQEGAII